MRLVWEVQRERFNGESTANYPVGDSLYCQLEYGMHMETHKWVT